MRKRCNKGLLEIERCNDPLGEVVVSHVVVASLTFSDSHLQKGAWKADPAVTLLFHSRSAAVIISNPHFYL